MTWRDNLDKRIKPHIERLIEESFEYKNSYNLAKDRGKAQIWVALALLSRQIYNIGLKLKYLETTLQNIARSKLKKAEAGKKEEKAVERFIKELARGKRSKEKKERKRKTRKKEK